MTPNPLDASAANPNPNPLEVQTNLSRTKDPTLLAEHFAALRRVWTHANGNHGQCRTTFSLLLCLYNGIRFPVDMTNLRALDAELFDDCLLVLQLDYRTNTEPHALLGVRGERFETIAKNWRFVDHQFDKREL